MVACHNPCEKLKYYFGINKDVISWETTKSIEECFKGLTTYQIDVQCCVMSSMFEIVLIFIIIYMMICN